MLREKPYQRVEILVSQSFKCGKMHEIYSFKSFSLKEKKIKLENQRWKT